ncbi:hypothetical protein BD408DRAFT_5953 [Parasitella parasitica]|nr:hypothetical protein BD408DRAFT_5953 [Parasitella parasitica]
MLLYNFDGLIINSRQIATESKDGIFSSFFNIAKLYNMCENHGLVFAHNMYVIPGRKTVRINHSSFTPSVLFMFSMVING